MGEILFFPWLRIPEPVYFEDFSLLPYQKGDCMEGCDQEVISVLENYLEHFYESSIRKIHGVTILSINAQIAYEIDESLEAKLASLIELIAFCGLSDRDFFLNEGSYCNRDNFQLKRFLIESNSVAYKKITRRRDGLNENIVSANSYREIMPDHVIYSRVRLNEKFLRSLVSAQSHSRNWDDIFQGIVNFNLSNSDSLSTSETIEIVSLVGAFEQLLGCKNGKENDLANKFIELFDMSININFLDCARLQNEDKRKKFQNCRSIQEIWMRDLFRLRGNLAHGRNPKTYPSLWTLKEHLLLSSFIFPLALKECLSKQNVYMKNHHDHQLIDFFPRILCQEDISRWSEFWREFLWDQVAEQRSIRDA
jgi:hypothetical protein